MRSTRADTRGTVARAVGVLIALIAVSIPVVGAASVDNKPPVVLVLPAQPVHGTEAIELRARVHDPSGVGVVRLHARGEFETKFREYPMVASGNADEYVTHVFNSRDRGSYVQYFVSATDKLNNGPRLSGTARSPFVAKILPPATAAKEARRARILWRVGSMIPFTVLFFIGYEYVRRCERSLPEKEKEKKAARRARTATERQRFWRGTGRAPNGNRCGPAALRVVSIDPSKRQIEDDVFWLRMLRLVLPLPKTRAEAALRDLATQVHSHPHDGPCTYDVKMLRARLEWARNYDPERLVDRWQSTHSSVARGQFGRRRPGPAHRPSPKKRASGVSLIELLVVLALMSITLGIGALYLRPAAAPLKSGAEMVEALIKQTRAKAMATTTVHRVRPFDTNSLVVEYAEACSSPTWTVDPRMDMDLPDQVTLDDTDWRACYTSRGVTTQNFVVTLLHASGRTQRLELLLGGAVRWVP